MEYQVKIHQLYLYNIGFVTHFNFNFATSYATVIAVSSSNIMQTFRQ